MRENSSPAELLEKVSKADGITYKPPRLLGQLLAIKANKINTSIYTNYWEIFKANKTNKGNSML